MTALPLTSVNHLAITSRDVEVSKLFWRDVLGFREVSRPAFDFRGYWLFNYGLMIHIIHNEAVPGSEGEIQTRGCHIALHTEDLVAVEQLLAEHGIPFRRNTIKDRGIQQLFFRDPDGHHIEIGNYPPTPPFI